MSRDKIKFFFDYLVVLNLILLSGSIYTFDYFELLFTFSITILFIGIFIDRNLIYKELCLILFFLVTTLVVLTVIFLFSPSNTISEYVTFYLRTFIASFSFLFLSKSIRNISKLLSDIFKIIATISLVGWFLSYIPIWSSVFFKNGSSLNSIFYIHFFGVFENVVGIKFYRNGGFFWEPGVLSVFMNIFLLISFCHYRNYKLAMLASIVIITTFSTTGLLTATLQWFFVIFKSKGVKKKIKVLSSLCLILPMLLIGYSSLVKKKSDEKIISSYGLRTLDLYTGCMVVFDHPIFGVGLNKEVMYANLNKHTLIEFLQDDGMDGRGNSNSIAQLFMIFGIPLSLIFLVFIYNQKIISKNPFLVFVVVFISLCSEPLIFSPFFLLMFYSGWRHLFIRVSLKPNNLAKSLN